MANERTILCGDAPKSSLPPPRSPPLALRQWGPNANVIVRIEDVREALWAETPDLFLDLIDLAAYVYTADQAILRSTDKDENFGENWRRTLHFAVAVRQPKFWSRPAVMRALVNVLSFLFEDEYHFQFTPSVKSGKPREYLDFKTDRFNGTVREVLLFSGGLDSLAGAVQAAIKEGRQVALIHHRSNPKITPVLLELVRELAARAADAPPFTFRSGFTRRRSCPKNQRNGRGRFFLPPLAPRLPRC